MNTTSNSAVHNHREWRVARVNWRTHGSGARTLQANAARQGFARAAASVGAAVVAYENMTQQEENARPERNAPNGTHR